MTCKHCTATFKKPNKLNLCPNCVKTFYAIEKDDIKQNVQVVDVLEHFQMQKSEDGRNYCCVNHSEKNPSMDIRKNFAHCYVCGFSGDAIQVYRAINGCDMASALLEMNETFCNNAFGIAKVGKNRMSEVKRRNEKKQYEIKRDAELASALKFCNENLKSRMQNYIKRIVHKDDISNAKLNECHKMISSVSYLQDLIEDAMFMLIFNK